MNDNQKAMTKLTSKYNFLKYISPQSSKKVRLQSAGSMYFNNWVRDLGFVLTPTETEKPTETKFLFTALKYTKISSEIYTKAPILQFDSNKFVLLYDGKSYEVSLLNKKILTTILQDYVDFVKNLK